MVSYLELGDALDSTQLVEALKRIEYNTQARTGGMISQSRVFGALPRNTIRRDFCTSASLANEQPEEHTLVCQYAERINTYYREVNAALFGVHDQTTQDKVEPEYRIKNSVFTSGIINKNNPLPYHYDSGNFVDVWSAMLVFKHQTEGGHLCVPELDARFELKNNSLFLFDGQGLLHGVTPIVKLTPDAHRFSIVYYSMRQMWNCAPLSDELIRIRKLKTEREERRALGINPKDVKKGKVTKQ